jgi:hypothetical protein
MATRKSGAVAADDAGVYLVCASTTREPSPAVLLAYDHGGALLRKIELPAEWSSLHHVAVTATHFCSLQRWDDGTPLRLAPSRDASLAGTSVHRKSGRDRSRCRRRIARGNAHSWRLGDRARPRPHRVVALELISREAAYVDASSRDMEGRELEPPGLRPIGARPSRRNRTYPRSRSLWRSILWPRITRIGVADHIYRWDADEIEIDVDPIRAEANRYAASQDVVFRVRIVVISKADLAAAAFQLPFEELQRRTFTLRRTDRARFATPVPDDVDPNVIAASLPP